jgi:Putative Flp pilus-assembly TadE/G-like
MGMGNLAQAGLALAHDRRRLLRGAHRDERGGILVMFALFMTLFALLCAVVVDVGYWWVMGKKTQVAADACALAAAAELPQTWNAPPLTHCEIAGKDYAKTNLPLEGLANEPRHMSTVVTTPYAQGGGDPKTYVEAEVTVVVRTFFGRVVGLDNIELSRRAVAEQSEGEPGNYAIYSHSSNCSEGLEFNGENYSINGRVHSNGEYLVNNGGSQPFWAKVGTTARPSCTSLQPSGSVRFGGTSWATGTPGATTVAPQTWPEWFTPAQFGWQTCSGANFSGQKIEIDSSTLKVDGVSKPFPIVSGQRQIPSGVYCARESFIINGNNIRGNITVLSREIKVNGDNVDLTPFSSNGVLFFQVPNIDTNVNNDGAPGGTGTLHCPDPKELTLFNGNNGSWTGKVFHPCGRILIDGNGTRSMQGAIYGLQVKVNGNGFTMIGTGGGGDAAKTIALVE